jgi:hypothetical protein
VFVQTHGLRALSQSADGQRRAPTWTVGAGGLDVLLRAERSAHGEGRAYTISATATDLVGNVAPATASCVVPHDQGNRK